MIEKPTPNPDYEGGDMLTIRLRQANNFYSLGFLRVLCASA